MRLDSFGNLGKNKAIWVGHGSTHCLSVNNLEFSDMSIKSTMLAGAAALALSASAASAAPLEIVGGTSGTIPEAGQTNEILASGLFFGGGTSLDGFFGSTITGNASSYTYEFLGFEAGFHNIFSVAGTTVFDTEDYAPANQAVGTPLETFASAVLDFAFRTFGSIPGDDEVTDDQNNPNTADNANYFASFGNGTDRQGSILYLFFDDAGNQDDDNHDDMAVRITAAAGAVAPIPVPAPLGLLVASLMGLGVLSFRRRKSTV